MPKGRLGAGAVPGPQGPRGPRRRGPDGLRAEAARAEQRLQEGATGSGATTRWGPPERSGTSSAPGFCAAAVAEDVEAQGSSAGPGPGSMLSSAGAGVTGGGGGPTAPRAGRPRPSARPAPRGSRETSAGRVRTSLAL